MFCVFCVVLFVCFVCFVCFVFLFVLCYRDFLLLCVFGLFCLFCFFVLFCVCYIHIYKRRLGQGPVFNCIYNYRISYFKAGQIGPSLANNSASSGQQAIASREAKQESDRLAHSQPEGQGMARMWGKVIKAKPIK